MSISENLAAIRTRIAAAAIRSGRNADAVALVAVSKYVDANVASLLVPAGCQDLGEARPQELCKKAAYFANENIRWHLIGHLQTNKVKRVLPYVSLIHSVDSIRLLNAINVDAIALARRVEVLLEVNISGDASKHGFRPEDMSQVLKQAASWPAIRIRGLMGMAALDGGLEVARQNFWQMRELRDKLLTHCPPEASLDELSMGMSGDYEVAIEAGATIVRIGSALFEPE